MLDLKTLQNAFSKIEEVGKGELTFALDSIPVTLRVLLPSEEITVQKFAAQAMAEGDDTDASTTADYLERFKQAVCSHALVAVGELDFRGVEFVETGETLDNGVPIKVPKHQAVRDILTNFSRGATTILFKKYGELLAQVEQDAEAATDFEIPDLDAEIKRLQDRIAELETTKAEDEAPSGVMDSAVNSAIKEQGEDFERAKEWGDELRTQQQDQAEADKRIADLKKAAEEGLREGEQTEPSKETAPTTRQPVSPTHAAPPPPLEQQEPSPEMTKEEVLTKVEEMSSEEPPSPTFSSQNTFIGDDPDSQLQAENERMAQVRAARAKQKQQDQLRRQETAVSPARRAPHLAAKEVADQMTNDAVVQVGSIDGIPAYSMGEPQELHDKVGGGQEPPVVVEQDNTKKGTVNPRFRQPK